MATRPTGALTRLLLHVPPSDRLVVALLGLAVFVAAVRLPVAGQNLLALLLVHALLLGGFLVAVALMKRAERSSWVFFARPTLTVAVVFTLYTTLGKLGMAAWSYRGDAALSSVDNALLGLDPSLAVQRFQTPGRVEFFSFIYAAFIPYIDLSLALGCLGRPPGERDEFLTGWVLVYAISYLGYVFVPAHGPEWYHAADYAVDLTRQGGYWYGVVTAGTAASGGLQGAFPSLHVGGSLYLCLFDLRTNRLRGLTYLPMVLLIYLATVFMRYHYVIDLLVGTVIAAGCVPLGRAVLLHWTRRRQALGLPALPGGEGDVLPALSGAGPAGAAPVLSAD